ncbi:hypothetical protein COS64_02515 [archaeon CG06_land_8_20_14_3_00_37_11]|nr:MAG: hypothetical protein COS64_02515 [archaeon CG06_land_8_20_14_3_00_37_11]
MNKFIVLPILVLFIAGCTQTEIANPAAVYCEDKGYNYDIRDTPIGQDGFCVFNDSSECSGWDYYHGECTEETASPCKDLCGNNICEEAVCQAIGCPCAENNESCPYDCI